MFLLPYKMVFYTVAIQRCAQKVFFMQSPYSGVVKNGFLYSRHTAVMQKTFFYAVAIQRKLLLYIFHSIAN